MGFGTDRLHRRAIASTVALFGLALMAALVSSSATAQSWTPEQRAACEGDAMRLCGQYVPDVARVTACMKAKRSQVSPRCRAAMAGKRRKF